MRSVVVALSIGLVVGAVVTAIADHGAGDPERDKLWQSENDSTHRLAVEERTRGIQESVEVRLATEAKGFSGSDPTSAAKERLIRFASRLLAVPYRFGGSSARGTDCSAYVRKVFGFLNIPVPRTAREQFVQGREVPRQALAPGDLVFFRTYAKFPSHVGIYLGRGRFIHASSTAKKVRVDTLDAPYYKKRFLGGRRLLDTVGEERSVVNDELELSAEFS